MISQIATIIAMKISCHDPDEIDWPHIWHYSSILHQMEMYRKWGSKYFKCKPRYNSVRGCNVFNFDIGIKINVLETHDWSNNNLQASFLGIDISEIYLQHYHMMSEGQQSDAHDAVAALLEYEKRSCMRTRSKSAADKASEARSLLQQ